MTTSNLTSFKVPSSIFSGFGKGILQVPDTGTRVLGNTGPFLSSSIVCFWIPAARSKECKYHIFDQYWYTKNDPVFTNTGTFQYLGPEVYFFPAFFQTFGDFGITRKLIFFLITHGKFYS